MQASPANPAIPNSAALRSAMGRIVGGRHVHHGAVAARRFGAGYRFGEGAIELAVTPGDSVELWRVASAAVAGGRIIVMQAANTGLTGGSTPHGGYGRPVVVINTSRIGRIHLVRGGEQAVCLAGATLAALERRLAPIGREPHSVISSSCLGASVVGGVCNNSGGALVRRGPAYTELALFAHVDDGGELRLVNHLGIALGDDPIAMLERLEAGDFGEERITADAGRAASSRSYEQRVRDVDAPTPARYNADPEHLFEASGSAGRAIVFAVRLDTFAKERDTRTFYLGTNAPDDLTRLRRAMLRRSHRLPVSAEYMHRDAFDLAARYGKDSFLAIRRLGPQRLPALFAAKRRAEVAAARLRLPRALPDRVLQWLGDRAPDHLPRRMREFCDQFAHHLILTVGADEAAETARLLRDEVSGAHADWFPCTSDEAERAHLHRFVTAGAAVRYRAIHGDEVEGIVALDIALRRDDRDWFEALPPELGRRIVKAIHYGHFFCHVFHQDYLIAKGEDPATIERDMLAILDRRGAEYPAEHNVGHLYPAKPALAAHYRSLDPTNRLNPGIGLTSRAPRWGAAQP